MYLPSIYPHRWIAYGGGPWMRLVVILPNSQVAWVIWNQHTGGVT
jgi:hypothetical protein